MTGGGKARRGPGPQRQRQQALRPVGLGPALALALLGALPAVLAGCTGNPLPEAVQRLDAPPETPTAAAAAGGGGGGGGREGVEYHFAEPIAGDLVRLRVTRPAGKAAADVLRFPVPRPYLLVKPGAKGEGMDLAVVYLPDSEEELLVQPVGRRGGNDLTVVLGPGGFLERASGRFRLAREHIDQAPIAAAPGPPAQPVRLDSSDLGRMTGGGLAPGLYRILLSDPLGGPAPRLERVQAYPLPAEEPPRVRAIRFRACPERPELVRRIEVETEGGSAPAVAALAGKIEVYRDGQPLAELGRKLEGDAIALAADGDCTGGFASYRVSLPAAAAAAGSELGAVFPSPEQLDLWRPKAEVHLVKDNQGAARYLVIEGDPGRGSPLRPPAREGPGAAVLLVNRKPARMAAVTRDVANANAYLVELAEPDPRSINFDWTPTNAAGLAGKPIAFAYTAPAAEEKKPDEVPIYVRDISLAPSGARYQLTLALEAGARRVDASRTAAGNQRKGWREIRCSPPGAAQLACTALIDSTSDLHFDVYCDRDEDRPCLTVGMAR